MADFSQDKKYNYNWQSSKFKNLALSGSYISQFTTMQEVQKIFYKVMLMDPELGSHPHY
jgi:hypothetical protein